MQELYINKQAIDNNIRGFKSHIELLKLSKKELNKIKHNKGNLDG